MEYVLPSLPYAYGALEPYIDIKTMEIHHTKHHQAYINNLNAALAGYPEFKEQPLEDLLKSIHALPILLQTAVRNQGGGHVNHSFFWQLMSPTGGGLLQGPLKDDIIKRFGSFDAFQDKFNAAAKSVFGSGWAWLVIASSGDLEVVATANQDSPIMFGSLPILGLDVWEHAYYLQYQNKRPDYIQAWWHVINWKEIEARYEAIAL